MSNEAVAKTEEHTGVTGREQAAWGAEGEEAGRKVGAGMGPSLMARPWSTGLIPWVGNREPPPGRGKEAPWRQKLRAGG